MKASRKALAHTSSVLFWLAVVTSSTAFAAAASAAPIYSYTDDAGILTFTTELHSIPDKYRNHLSRHDFDSPAAPPAPVVAELPVPPAAVQVVTASGEYRMGHHDTRTDAVRLAVEAAKKHALEQVASYLESVTEVRNMDIRRDDLRSYTAGIVKVLDERITTRLEEDTIVIRADLTAEVDPHQVAQAISALRQNESARQELMALRAETDQLQRQLDETNRALAAAASSDEAETLNQQRQDMLNELQANALVSQAWTNWAYATPGITSSSWIGLPGINGLLLQAQRLSPQHRHLPFAYQTITTGIGTVPSISQSNSPAARSSLLVPSLPYPLLSSPQSYTIPPGSGAFKGGAPSRTPTQTGVPTIPNQSSSSSSQPSPYQLHPSHFWRPSPPNIHTAPSAPLPNPSVAPKSSGGFFGHPGSSGGYFGSNGGGGRFGGSATGSGRGR